MEPFRADAGTTCFPLDSTEMRGPSLDQMACVQQGALEGTPKSGHRAESPSALCACAGIGSDGPGWGHANSADGLAVNRCPAPADVPSQPGQRRRRRRPAQHPWKAWHLAFSGPTSRTDTQRQASEHSLHRSPWTDAQNLGFV